MGVQKKTRKFAQVKRIIGQRDARLKKNQDKGETEGKRKAKGDEKVREMYHHPSNPSPSPSPIRQTPFPPSLLIDPPLSPQVSSSLFFQYNTALVPPYSILVDTNFLSHTIQNHLDLLPAMMDCLYAKCTPVITSCVMAELEKLGPKYRLALRIARDERWDRLKCDHKGVYADDCLVDRVMKHKVYIIATNDRDLKRRVRKIPGVPIMSVARGKYVIERLPDAPEK
ncbi:hypothetical protein MMC12_003451 [Toensbergia leucococca]|nr:hypothetical protein [Toensbergia leucococca]